GFFFSSGRRHTRFSRDWSSDVCSSDLPVETEGDLDRRTPLPEMGGRGVFVREVERRLIEGSADLAVHSLKDLPTAAAPGLVVAAVPERGDPRDALVTREGLDLDALPSGARLGTGSTRRMAQIAWHRKDLVIEPIRGNIDTRIGRVERGEIDGVVLAVAGLVRARMEGSWRPIPADIVVPAPGQGALAVQCRADDAELRSLLGRI